MGNRTWLGTAADGDWNTTTNWSGSSVPTNGDDVFIEATSDNIALTLDQSAVALASLNISSSFTGTIGTATAPLKIGSVLVKIGYNKGASNGNGSGRINLDLGSATASTVVIFGSRTSATDNGVNPIHIIAANSSTNIFIRGGKVSIADQSAETSTIGVIDVSQTSGSSNVSVGYLSDSAGVTLTTFNQSDGVSQLNCGCTTANIEGGTVTTEGSGAITTVNVKAGNFISNSTGTITTLNVWDSVDMTKCNQARTVTTTNLYAGSTFKFASDVITTTNKPAFLDTKPVTVSVS